MCEITDWMIWLLLAGCGVIDWKKKSIPLWLLIVFGMAATLSLFFCRERSVGETVGGILVGIILLLISRCTKEAIGYGDSFMILFLGMYLGGVRVLLVLFGASFMAGICALFSCQILIPYTHLWYNTNIII